MTEKIEFYKIIIQNVKPQKVKEIFDRGCVFYYEDNYYEIIDGKAKRDFALAGIKPINLRVQKLKFILQKTECVPIDNFKNRECYIEDHYILDKDDNVEPFFHRILIYYRDFYKKNSIKKIVFHKPEGEYYEIIREQDKYM